VKKWNKERRKDTGWGGALFRTSLQQKGLRASDARKAGRRRVYRESNEKMSVNHSKELGKKPRLPVEEGGSEKIGK